MCMNMQIFINVKTHKYTYVYMCVYMENNIAINYIHFFSTVDHDYFCLMCACVLCVICSFWVFNEHKATYTLGSILQLR